MWTIIATDDLLHKGSPLQVQELLPAQPPPSRYGMAEKVVWPCVSMVEVQGCLPTGLNGSSHHCTDPFPSPCCYMRVAAPFPKTIVVVWIVVILKGDFIKQPCLRPM